jgi:hypothetical protein
MNVYQVVFFYEITGKPMAITVMAKNSRSAARKAKNRLAINLNLTFEERPSLTWFSTDLVLEQLKFGGGGRIGKYLTVVTRRVFQSLTGVLLGPNVFR